MRPKIMFIAAALKQEMITKGISIPNFLATHPELQKLPKEDINYIKGQGKKLLLAMNSKRR